MSSSLIAIATHMPEQKLVHDLIVEAGGDPSKYSGWKKICVSNSDEHPSSMSKIVLSKAIERAGASIDDFEIIVSTGSTFDYPPSWSVSNELMFQFGASTKCVGFDISQGCVAGMTGIDVVDRWLTQPGKGLAAVVCAQRWAHSIDRADARNTALWGWGDGAAAMIFSRDLEDKRSQLNYLGGTFASRATLHGTIHRLYGGTRTPVAPQGVNQFAMDINTKNSTIKFFKMYQEAYTEVIGGAKKAYGRNADWVVCNHVSPGIVETIRSIANVPVDRLVHRGEDIGHVSSADVAFDLEVLLKDRPIKKGDTIFAVGSGQHTFACGVFVKT